jgi:hypothetical protein
MKIGGIQLNAADRATANAQAEEIASRLSPEVEKPTFLQTTVAAIEEGSTLKANIPGTDEWNRRWDKYRRPDAVSTDEFSPVDYVPKDMLNTGQLDHVWDDIVRATSPLEVQDVINQTNIEGRRREIIANGSGWAGFWGSTIGLFSSPELWPGLLWNPVGGVTRTALSLGAIAGTETAFQEATLQATQVSRDPYQSFATVGTALVGGAVVGGAVGKFIKPRQIKKTYDEIGAEIDEIANNNGLRDPAKMPEEMPPVTIENMGSTAGAQRAGLGAEEKPIRGLRWKTGWISALRPLAKARVPVVHEKLNQFFGHDLQLRMNDRKVTKWNPETQKFEETGEVEHLAKNTSLSRVVDREINQYEVSGYKVLREEFMKYVGYKGKSMTIARVQNRGLYEEFNRKVDWAMRNNDLAEDPADVAVTSAAERLRSEVYGPIEKLAHEADMFAAKQRKALERRVDYLRDKVEAAEGAKLVKLKEQLKKAESDLEKMIERTGEVKFADSYLTRRFNSVAVEDNASAIKTLLRKRYEDLRRPDIYKDMRRMLEAEIKALKEAKKPTEALERELKELTPENVKISGEMTNSIEGDVLRTYRKMVDGELFADVWHARSHTARVFKQRELPLTDNELLELGVLRTDMLGNIKGYVNSTLRPIRMKQAAGDTEMEGVLEEIETNYEIHIKRLQDAGKSKEATSLRREMNQVGQAMQTLRNRYYGRTELYQGNYASAANIWRSLRNLNVFRMMGGVLTTSMNDIARLNAAKIFAPELGRSGPGLISAWRTLRSGLTRESLEAAGFAAETVNMMRFEKFVDMGVPIASGNRFSKGMLNLTGVGAKALMKATLLTHWTDFMKLMAAVMTQNQTMKMMRGYSKLSRRNKTILAEMGIDEDFAKIVSDQFDQHGDRIGKHGYSLNWDDWTDQEAAERMKDIMFRQSERILVTPRESDLPVVLAETEMGRAFLQFKSFSLAAHNQTTVPLLERAQSGDLMTIYTISMMSVGAAATEIVKMYESGREDELAGYSGMDLALAVADRSAVAPMLNMAFNNIDLALGNRITREFGARPVSRYSTRNVLGAIGGPTAGTVGDIFALSSALASEEWDYKDARAAKRLAPFQNYMLLNRAANKMLPQKGRTKSKRREMSDR